MFFRLPGASVSLVLQHLVHADAAQQEKDPSVPQSGQELPPESIPIKEGIRQPPPEKGYKIAEKKADAVPSGQYVLPGLHGAVDAALCADKAHKADKRNAHQRGKKKCAASRRGTLSFPRRNPASVYHTITLRSSPQGEEKQQTHPVISTQDLPKPRKKEKFVEFY